jgi:hypothetical protein
MLDPPRHFGDKMRITRKVAAPMSLIALAIAAFANIAQAQGRDARAHSAL